MANAKQSAITNASIEDIEVALAFFNKMREQCINDEGEELPGMVTAAMLVASVELSSEQFRIVAEMVKDARTYQDWEIGYSLPGVSWQSECGKVWGWTPDLESPEAQPREVIMERDGDDIAIYLLGVKGGGRSDTHDVIASTKISRATLLKLAGL